MAHRISLNFAKRVQGYNPFCLTSFHSKLGKQYNSAIVYRFRELSTSNVKRNSQHRVILLPEVPPDNHLTNPLLKKFEGKTDNETKSDLDIIPDFDSITDRDLYFGYGKALLEFEAAVDSLEKKCEENIKDFDALFGEFETALCQFQSVQNSVQLLNLTTDKFDGDRLALLNNRAEVSATTRFTSKKIHEHLKLLQTESTEGKITLDEQQKRQLEKYLAE